MRCGAVVHHFKPTRLLKRGLASRARENAGYAAAQQNELRLAFKHTVEMAIVMTQRRLASGLGTTAREAARSSDEIPRRQQCDLR